MCSHSRFVGAIKAVKLGADVRVAVSLRVGLPPNTLNIKSDPVNGDDTQNITACVCSVQYFYKNGWNTRGSDLMDSAASLTCSGTTNQVHLRTAGFLLRVGKASLLLAQTELLHEDGSTWLNLKANFDIMSWQDERAVRSLGSAPLLITRAQHAMT